MAMLTCAVLRFPQQTEELLHLGHFHFWTLRQHLTLFTLHTHTEERERERERVIRNELTSCSPSTGEENIIGQELKWL